MRFMAPELLNEDVSTPTKESDIYAYAMTCYEILSGDVPFKSVLSEAGIIRRVTGGQRPDRTERFHFDFMWDIITQCWEQEPKDRLVTEKVVGLLRPKVDWKGVEEEQAEKEIALAKIQKEMAALKEQMAAALAKAEEDRITLEEKDMALAKAEEVLNEKDVAWAKEMAVLKEQMAEAQAKAEEDMKVLKEEKDKACAKVEEVLNEKAVLKEQMSEAQAKAEENMEILKEEKEKASAKAEEDLKQKDVAWGNEIAILRKQMAEVLEKAEEDMKALREEKDDALKTLAKAEEDLKEKDMPWAKIENEITEQMAEAQEEGSEKTEEDPKVLREEKEDVLARAKAEEDLKMLKDDRCAQLSSQDPDENRNARRSFSPQRPVLDKLEGFVSFTAQLDPSAQDSECICHPVTRQRVLRRMKDWIDDPSSTEHITWLHCPADAGTSAIAQTIAKSYDRQKVAATFFFSSDPSRNDGNMLFPTLADQLAFSIPAVKDCIVESLRQHPDLLTKSIETQFEHLIALPFQSLSEAASAQSSPVHVVDAVNQYQRFAPVIIIDGVDECTDEKLQQSFLRTIGNAAENRSVPFRFIICNRSEGHIEDALDKFKALILPIDLAKWDDERRDTEKYLEEQFSSIASNRGLDPTWPGRDIIHNILFKSDGERRFASVFINIISDEDGNPEDQLAIILNVKQPEESPSTVIDELYLEILKRQLYQDFLKTFLSVIVGRMMFGGFNNYEDDSKLMNISEQEFHTKLHGMRSILKFGPYSSLCSVYRFHIINFFYFLVDPSRAGDYFVTPQAGIKQSMELVVDSIVRYASRMIQNPNYHETQHFNLKFEKIIKRCSWRTEEHLSNEELRDVSQPLIQIQDEILQRPDSHIANNLLTCHKCAVFNVMRPLLLHVAIHQCIDAAHSEAEESVTEGKAISVIPVIQSEQMQSALGNDLDSSLSSLLTHLQEAKLKLPPSTTIINDTYSILGFDCAETAVKVRSMSDAQRLVDFLVYLIDEKYILGQYKPNGMGKVAQLVLNIFLWIPILPRSLFLNMTGIPHPQDTSLESYVQDACLSALIWRVLDKNYIHIELSLLNGSFNVPSTYSETKWRQVLPLDSITVIELMLDAARAIQYLHLMGVGISGPLSEAMHLDLGLRPKIRIAAHRLDLINPCTRSRTRRHYLSEDNVLHFGCFCYEMYFNSNIKSFDAECGRIKRPSNPKIPDYAWQLIQHCWAPEPENRLTIDEVVKEMETWKNQPK